MDRNVLEKKALAELREIASTLEISGYQRLKKAELVAQIVGSNGSRAVAENNGAGNGHGSARTDERDDDRDRDDRGSDDRGSDDRGSDDRGSDDRGSDDRNRTRTRNKRTRSKRSGDQQQQEDLSDAEVREGVLDLLPEGYGFLRCTGYLSGPKDVYVSQSFVRRFDLRRGDRYEDRSGRNRGNDKFPALGGSTPSRVSRSTSSATVASSSRTSRRCSPTSGCDSRRRTSRRSRCGSST
jgi:transcription termination factor Rho